MSQLMLEMDWLDGGVCLEEKMQMQSIHYYSDMCTWFFIQVHLMLTTQKVKYSCSTYFAVHVIHAEQWLHGPEQSKKNRLKGKCQVCQLWPIPTSIDAPGPKEYSVKIS